MKIIVLLSLLTSLAFSNESELKDHYSCGSEQSLVGAIVNSIGNSTRHNGKKGYYTSALRFNIDKTESGKYVYEFLGEAAFCNPGEQCAGLYTITSGETEVSFENGVIKSEGNPLVTFTIDTESGKCKAKILDFRIKKKLTKFKGELY